MFRYLGFMSDAGNQPLSQVVQALTQNLTNRSRAWRKVVNEVGLQLYCTDAQPDIREPHLLHNGSGAVLGTIFSNDENPDGSIPAQKARFGADETARLIATNGRNLISSYWGCYVAFLRDPVSDRKWVIRDPAGSLPCYYTTFRGVTILFSYAVDLLELGIPQFEVDWTYISQRVSTSARRPGCSTALKNVQRVRGGECVEFSPGQQTRSFYWDPIQIARTNPIEDPRIAAEILRSTIRHCTHAWTFGHERVLHRLSGGLDSSIVLSCLADAPASSRVSCLTMYVPGEASNEQRWARLAAERAQCEHVEIAADLQVDLTRMLRATPDVQPESGFGYLLQDAETDLARSLGASASFSGDGGDSLFGATTVRFAVSDYLGRHAVDRRLLRVAGDVAIRLDISIWTLLARAVQDRFIRRPDVPLQNSEQRKFVNADVVRNRVPDEPIDHPWAQALDNDARSAIRTISPLLRSGTIYDPFNRPDDPELARIAPLISQPVVELCLRIPSYVHAMNGRSRGLARHAFANDVPREILQRQWKDRPPNGFHAVMFEQNRELIRQILLDGVLVSQGLMNKAELENVLTKESFELTHRGTSEIFDHMNIECWLRNWADLDKSTTCRKQA